LRPLHEEMLDILEEVSNAGKTPKMLVVAPPGYGKTSVGPLIYKRLRDLELVETFQHILPLRAIIRDFYVCTLIQSLAGEKAGEVRSKYGCREIPPDIRRSIECSGLKLEDVAYQMGERLELGGLERKEPLFNARYVVTTLDSFIYNLFRVPVTEIFAMKRHYAIPRLRIFLGAAYFDEAHVVFEEEEEASIMYTAFLEALSVLSIAGAPIILVTATLSSDAERALKNVVSDLYVVRLGAINKREDYVVEVFDHEFVDEVSSLEWMTTVQSECEAIKRAEELASIGYRVLITSDTIRRAVERFKKLRDRVDKIVLIHGLLINRDREKALKELNKANIVVATSVIEAGVNADFDVLVTDGTKPTSIIQRTGRVCRNIARCLKCGVKPEIIVVRDYGRNDVIEYLERIGSNISWRLPFNYRSHRGYQELVELSKLPKEDVKLKHSLTALLKPLFVSSYTIDQVLSEADYALARLPLVGAIVSKLDEVEQLSAEDLEGRRLTLPMSKVCMLAEKGCIGGLVLVSDDKLKVASECRLTRLLSGYRKGCKGFKYAELVHCERKLGGELLLLLKSECYEQGIGVVIW